jgi:hypothetical protein
MAAAVADFFQRSNIGLGTWNWSDVAFGFRSGLLLNQTSEQAIDYNNLPHSPNLNEMRKFTMLGLALSPMYKARRLARVDSLIASHLRSISLSSCALGVVTFIALNQNLYYLKTHETTKTSEKLLIRVWRATPYLVLVTNIALTLLEMRHNCMKASVALAVTSITLLDLAKITPKSWGWYINPGLRIPMDLVALYYGSNKNRFYIIVGWTQIPFIQAPMMKFLTHCMARLKEALQKRN